MPKLKLLFVGSQGFSHCHHVVFESRCRRRGWQTRLAWTDYYRTWTRRILLWREGRRQFFPDHDEWLNWEKWMCRPAQTRWNQNGWRFFHVFLQICESSHSGRFAFDRVVRCRYPFCHVYGRALCLWMEGLHYDHECAIEEEITRRYIGRAARSGEWACNWAVSCVISQLTIFNGFCLFCDHHAYSIWKSHRLFFITLTTRWWWKPLS